jgi:hypothetical protein
MERFQWNYPSEGLKAARTMHQAFPKTADYACAIEGPQQYDRLPVSDKIVMWACVIGGVAVAVMAVFNWLPGGAA